MPMYFSERFAAARGRKNLTLRDVAKACRVSLQEVKRWDAGTCYPSRSALIQLSEVADCSAAWLMHNAPLDFHSTPDGRRAEGANC